MLTKEREQQIRTWVDVPKGVFNFSGDIIVELLEEVDRLRIHNILISQLSDEQSTNIKYLVKQRDELLAEKERLGAAHETVSEFYKAAVEERNRLKAELVDERKENYADDYNFACEKAKSLAEENQRLRERIDKLRKVILWAAGPTREVKTNGLKAALLEDLMQAEDAKNDV